MESVTRIQKYTGLVNDALPKVEQGNKGLKNALRNNENSVRLLYI